MILQNLKKDPAKYFEIMEKNLVQCLNKNSKWSKLFVQKVGINAYVLADCVLSSVARKIPFQKINALFWIQFQSSVSTIVRAQDTDGRRPPSVGFAQPLILGSFDPGFCQIFANFSFQANLFFVTFRLNMY